jgi:PleD family two-component response regulator
MDKILIVDDSKSITQVLKTTILELGVFEVVVCSTYKETQQLLEMNTDFIVAVLDLNLPDAPNGEVVEYVVQKTIPSIVLTKCLNNKLRDKILQFPIVDYVVKNSMNELFHVVSLINRLKKNPQIKILVVDDSTSYRAYLTSLLQVHCYHVLEAVDGEDAMTVLNKYKNQIWLVITDYNMPKKMVLS